MRIPSWIFYPVAFLPGLRPDEVPEAARLLGERAIFTEVVSYQELSAMIASGTVSDPRTVVIMSYALCGFADVASVSIFIGGPAASVPSRRDDLASLGWRALLAATLATLMTACVAGTLSTGEGMMVLTRLSWLSRVNRQAVAKRLVRAGVAREVLFFVGFFCFGWEDHSVKNFFETERTGNRIHVQAASQVENRSGDDPLTVCLAGEMLDHRQVLRHHDIIGQRRIEGAVAAKLLAAIKGFGRRRKDLDNHFGVDEYVLLRINKLRLAAYDHQIRIRK